MEFADFSGHDHYQMDKYAMERKQAEQELVFLEEAHEVTEASTAFASEESTAVTELTPHQGEFIAIKRPKPQQLSLLSFFSPAPQPKPKDPAPKIEYSEEKSIDKPHVRVRMPVKLKNTEKYFNHVQRDLEKRLHLELSGGSNVESAMSSKGKVDREQLELCERMRERKEHCRQVLYHLLNL